MAAGGSSAGKGGKAAGKAARGSGAARLVKDCRAAGLVGLDTMIFIYQVQDHPTYAPLTGALLAATEKGDVRAVASTLALTELLVRPLQEGAETVAGEYYLLLTSFPHLTVAAAGPEVARLAAELRADLGLRTPDALHIATAMHEGAGAFVTNDRRLAGAAEEGFRVLVLEDYVGG